MTDGGQVPMAGIWYDYWPHHSTGPHLTGPFIRLKKGLFPPPPKYVGAIGFFPPPRCWALLAMRGWVRSFWKVSAFPRRSPSSWEVMYRYLTFPVPLAWLLMSRSSIKKHEWYLNHHQHFTFNQAKRYLVFKNPSYHDCLSEASKGTLVCQVHRIIVIAITMSIFS